MIKRTFFWVVFLLSAHALITAAELVPAGEGFSTSTFQVEIQDLHFDQENILVDVGGHLYKLSSLEKRGNQWVAEISYGKCAWGHPLCRYCELCHTRVCPLYQSRCSNSK